MALTLCCVVSVTTMVVGLVTAQLLFWFHIISLCGFVLNVDNYTLLLIGSSTTLSYNFH